MSADFFVADESGRYTTQKPLTWRQIVVAAAEFVATQAKNTNLVVSSPDSVRVYLNAKLAEQQKEVFMVLYLDTQHRLIQASEEFTGTVDECAVYPRWIAREALKCDASAIIVAHNHPSGSTEPSKADIKVTNKIKQALELLNIRLLDHFIVGESKPLSMVEAGFI